MVTTRQAVTSKATRINLDTMMEDVVHEDSSVAQATPNEDEITYDSDYNGEDPSSRWDHVRTKETTYLEDEEAFVQDGYYKDGYHYEKDPDLEQVAEELAVTKAKLLEQECAYEEMKRAMARP